MVTNIDEMAKNIESARKNEKIKRIEGVLKKKISTEINKLTSGKETFVSFTEFLESEPAKILLKEYSIENPGYQFKLKKGDTQSQVYKGFMIKYKKNENN